MASVIITEVTEQEVAAVTPAQEAVASQMMARTKDMKLKFSTVKKDSPEMAEAVKAYLKWDMSTGHLNQKPKEKAAAYRKFLEQYKKQCPREYVQLMKFFQERCMLHQVVDTLVASVEQLSRDVFRQNHNAKRDRRVVSGMKQEMDAMKASLSEKADVSYVQQEVSNLHSKIDALMGANQGAVIMAGADHVYASPTCDIYGGVQVDGQMVYPMPSLGA